MFWAILAGAIATAEPVVRPDGTILNPRFDKTPQAWQLRRAAEGLPPWVLQQRLPGYAVVSCDVTADGGVENCSVIEEGPANAGFGQAALKLTQLFHLAPLPNGTPLGGGKVRIPIGFGMRPPAR